ncbi:catenin alpha [Trichonephila clavipes]|nr:catenin alpha [Trichonephila clavipes]
MKRKRKEVPEFVKKVNTPLYDTMLVEHDDIIDSLSGKNQQKALLLSPLHPTVDIGNNHPEKLSEIIFYNSTKFGVDITDQIARKYSVRRRPAHVFYNILDLAGNNSWVLYKSVTDKKKLTMREYLQKLIEVLRSAYIHKSKYLSDTQTKPDNTEESAQIRKRVQCKDFQCGNKTVDTCS